MFCPYCGKELDDGSKFCIHCGERLEEDTNAVEAAKETVEKAVEAVNEAAESAAEAVKEVAEDTAEKAVETAENTVETVTETAEAAAETAEAAVETATETAEAAAETVENAVETATETAESAVEAAAETAAEAVEAPEDITVEKDGAAKTVDFAALLKNKTAVIIAAAAIGFFVLVALIVCIGGVSSGSGTPSIKGIYYVYSDSGEGSVLYNGKKIKGTDLSTRAGIAMESLDGSKAVLRDGSNALYYLADGKISKITEDFDNTMVNISTDGSTVLYFYDSAIYTYKGGKTAKAADIEKNLAAPAVVSPNGDTIVYAETDGEKISTYAVKGGKVTDLDAKIIPFSVSNGGGVVYGIDKNSKLNYIKNLKKDSAESVKNISLGFTPVLSSDNKQLMFGSDNGIYYYDTSLKEEIKVTGNSISIIYPEGCVEACENFKSFIAYSDGKVIKFTRKGKDFNKETLASSAYDCMLSADGKRIVYTQSDDLYRVNISSPDKKIQLANEVYDYDADNNLKNVYFVDRDDALRYADGKSKNGKKIIDDVYDFVVTPDGVCVFIDDDDTLFYSAGGSDKKKAGVDDVDYIDEDHGTVYVESDDDIYVSTDGKKFAKQ